MSRTGTCTTALPPAGADPLAAHQQALRERFPSRDELLAQARAQTARQAARRKRARIAATAATVGAVAALWIADPAWKREEIRTAAGEQSTWSLADGSQLRLNTATRLTVDSRLRSRRFTLHEGEAAFTVAHGWRPFTVEAGPVVVRDIGTAFNVRLLGQDRVRVDVTEGVVEVRHAKGAEVVAAPRRIEADAGGLADAPAGGQATVLAWQRGQLVFDGTPLAEVAAELSRYRARPVTVADPAVARLRLSATHDVRGLESLIDALPHALPVAVLRQPDGGVLLGRPPEKNPAETSTPARP